MLVLKTSDIINNELYIGGLSVSSLKEKYGSPLYIIDQADLENRLKTFTRSFQSDHFQTHVIYASKAFSNLYVTGLVKEYGLYMDVVSGGELHIALKAGMDPQRIYFHGNNKTPEEIEAGLEAGVGTFVVDHAYEYQLLSQLAKEKGKEVSVLLRINPGIEASTHKYIQTTTNDSKFGISTDDPELEQLVKRMDADPVIDFRGFHCHVGSQITQEHYFFEEAEVMIRFSAKASQEWGVPIRELNLGGGFGVQHRPGEAELDFGPFLERYIQVIEQEIEDCKLQVDVVSIEPGRSLINNSGYTLYTVGHVKRTLEGLPLVFIDGGMSDNLRPALYQAEYHAYLANRMQDPIEGSYRVAGKMCESGDILIQSVELPEAEPGDLLVIPASGAYTYVMSSNYNMQPRPAVVFVKDGQAIEAVKAQTYDDLIQHQSYYSK